MKTIKRISRAAAFVVACICVFSVLSGCKKCKNHDVSAWETVVPSTCSVQGIEQGICAECLETVQRKLPLNPDNHDYGEWQVELPTEETEGSAVKVCKHNSSHKESSKLPVLSSNKYTSSVTKRPSASSDGERTFVFKHIAGDISFKTPISSGGIQTVRDAVEVCSASESRNLIRSAAGTIGYEYHSPAIDGWINPETGEEDVFPANDQVYIHSYDYEFGDNYTHIDSTDYDDTERWYSVVDGEVFGFAKSDDEGFVSETERGVADAENYIDGFRFVLMYEMDLGAFYGTENLLAGLYKAARLSSNEDFEESVTQVDGETVYKFQFGHYDRETDGRFGNVKVEFTVTDEYTIKSVDVVSVVYVNNTDLNISTNGKFNTWKLTNVNGKQVARVIEGKEEGARYIDSISVEQKTKSETFDKPAPTNPYPKEGTAYESFDIVYNNNVIDENSQPINCSATASVSLKIENILPESAKRLGIDGFRVFLRTEKNGDVPIDFSTIDTIGVNANIVYGNQIVVRSKIAGEVTLVVKSALIERVIKLNVSRIAPSSIMPVVYRYSPSGYSENKSPTSTAEATVFVGQPLYFRACPTDLEVNYTDGTTVGAVTEGNASVCTIVDNVGAESLPFVNSGNAAISSFVATEAGQYTLTLTTAKIAAGQSQGVTCTITVNVEEPPSIDDVLSNKYAVNLEYPVKGKAEISFEKSYEQTLATVKFNGREIVLKCLYDEETKELSTEILSGADLMRTEYNFSLSLNEAYDIVLSHPMGDAYEGMLESSVIWRDVSQILSGVYTAQLNSPIQGDAMVVFGAMDGDGNISATVTFNGKTVKLLCLYDVSTKQLTSKVISNDGGEEYNFSLAFDNSFRLVLSHNTSSGVESVVLSAM